MQAFFPKNRGQWKAFSSWEPPAKEAKGGRAKKAGAGEVKVKHGYSWSEQVGIVVKALEDAGEGELVNWVIDVSGSSASTFFRKKCLTSGGGT